MRGLFDGSHPFEPDDVVAVKVKPVYVAMIASAAPTSKRRATTQARPQAFEKP
jgi:hypothetical protein